MWSQSKKKKNEKKGGLEKIDLWVEFRLKVWVNIEFKWMTTMQMKINQDEKKHSLALP